MARRIISFILIFIILFTLFKPNYINAEDKFSATGNQLLQSEGISVTDAIMKNLLEYSIKVNDSIGMPTSIEGFLQDKSIDQIDKLLPGFGNITKVYDLFCASIYTYTDYLKATYQIPSTAKTVLNAANDSIETNIMAQGNLVASIYQSGVNHRDTDELVPIDMLRNADGKLKDKRLLEIIYENADKTLIKTFAKDARTKMLKLAKDYESFIDNTPPALNIYNLGRYGYEKGPNIVDGLYSIKKIGTNLSFDVANYGTAKGTNLQVTEFKSNTAQFFRIENANGAIRIWSICSPNLVVDIGGNDTSTRRSGTNVDLWTLNADYSKNYWKDQEWTFVRNDDGSYFIRAKHYPNLVIGTVGSNVQLVNESVDKSVKGWIIKPIITESMEPQVGYLHKTENVGLRVRIVPDGKQIGHLSESLNPSIIVFGKPVNGCYKVKGIDSTTKNTVY